MQFSQNVTKIQAESGESKIFCWESFPINMFMLVQLQLSGHFLMSNCLF